VGGAQIWKINVGYNGYYQGALGAVNFLQGSARVMLWGVATVQGVMGLAEGGIAALSWARGAGPGAALWMRLFASEQGAYMEMEGASGEAAESFVVDVRTMEAQEGMEMTTEASNTSAQEALQYENTITKPPITAH
jgi:hypothetical protein